MGAWVLGGAAAVVAARHAKKIESLACPGSTALVERARGAAKDAPPGSVDTLARLELELIRDETSRTLALATLVPRGMARIALASGTAFAVLALATELRNGVVPATATGTAAFVGGALGSALAAAFGRRAREAAATARTEWKRGLAAAERELGKER